MQAEDGMLHLAYAYKTRISVKWVTLHEEDVIGASRSLGTYNPTSGEITK